MDKTEPADEGEIALVAVVLNTDMPGGRQPINSNSNMHGRVGGQPTPQGLPIGPSQNHIMAYNSDLRRQHYTARPGLLPPPQLSSAPYPNYHPMAHQQQGYGNGMLGHDMYDFHPPSGGQFGAQSSNGNYAPAQNAHQTSRLSNGFNAPAASSMQAQQHLLQHTPGGQQRMTPLPAAAAPSRTTPSTSSTTSSPSPVPQNISTWKKVYLCGVCPDSDSPYRYDETDDEQPPSLTVCRSEHLMDSAICKANFIKLFGSDWKKASGSECLEREVVEEAVWCVLCQVVIRGKDKWRRLHLMSAEHQTKLAANAPPILSQQLHLNDLQQQHQQQNLAMLQQQRTIFQQQPVQHYQMAQQLPQTQEVYQQTLQSSYQAPNMMHISPPPAYSVGNGMAGQMATSRSTHCRSNRSSTNASPATNEQKDREQRILTLLGQHTGPALQNQGGQREGMLPLGGAFHESVEARPSMASSVSVGSTPRGSISFDDISPHGSPTPATITPQTTTRAVASIDNRPRYQSPMDMAAEVMNDPGSFPDGLDLPSASSQGSLSSEPAHNLPPTVNVSSKADPGAATATPLSPTVEVAPSAAPVVIPAAAQTPTAQDAATVTVAPKKVDTVSSIPAQAEAEGPTESVKKDISPPAKEEKARASGSQSMLDLAAADAEEEVKLAGVVAIKAEPKDELDMRYAAGNDINEEFFKAKRSVSPTNENPPTPPKKHKAAAKREVSVASDPGIVKKNKTRPQNVGTTEREAQKLYICKCGELLPRKRDYFSHWERHAKKYSELKAEQRQLYCVRAQCGYLAKDDVDYTRHAARHVLLQVMYRKHC